MLASPLARREVLGRYGAMLADGLPEKDEARTGVLAGRDTVAGVGPGGWARWTHTQGWAQCHGCHGERLESGQRGAWGGARPGRRG
jgi:hypothetical protein